MVDHDGCIQATSNTDILDAAGWVIGGFAELPYDIAIEHMVHEGTLSRTGDAGDHTELADGQLDVDATEVVLPGTDHADLVIRLLASGLLL